MPANPYAEFVEEAEIDPTQLASVSKLAAQIEDEEAGIASLEKELAEAKKRHKKLTMTDMPDLMETVGMETFTTSDGLSVKIEKKTRTSLPADRIERGCDWMEEHGHGAIVKRVVSVNFNKDDEDKAKLLTEICGASFPDTEMKRSIHSSTLNAQIRQMVEAGHEVDLDLFGVHEQKIAKIGRKKKK